MEKDIMIGEAPNKEKGRERGREREGERERERGRGRESQVTNRLMTFQCDIFPSVTFLQL